MNTVEKGQLILLLLTAGIFGSVANASQFVAQISAEELRDLTQALRSVELAPALYAGAVTSPPDPTAPMPDRRS